MDMKGNGPELIRFDWAMKRLLRDKVNHGILEGLITTLLNKKIHIQKLLESESNQDDADDKYNRVDILAEDENGGLYLIEVQNETEFAYFQRMLFGTSKLVTEYIKRGQGYENIRKVYSINIVYFNIGCGTDIVYHGKTEFRGIHNNELLSLSTFQKQKFDVSEVSELYPEYYILKVNDFNRWSKVPLEQWIYFLNTGEIPDDATAPGLNEAREKLKLERMTKAELNAYYHHLDNVVVLRDNIYTARNEGRIDGLAEGLAEGLEKGLAEGLEKGLAEGLEKGLAEGEKKAKTDIAGQLKAMGLMADKIAAATGLTTEEIEAIRID
ncbi:MAG: Rpn family recombination-promoting nuclease/putative transposase [Prevotella sp.]|nr:Rpn family recombination-promoting nuclease/putative transposase [Prevotella sp.]